MSWYEMHDVIDAGHHSMWIDNEDGDIIARGEGDSFFSALDNLKKALPTSRKTDEPNFWLHPLDETEEDYFGEEAETLELIRRRNADGRHPIG